MGVEWGGELGLCDSRPVLSNAKAPHHTDP